MGKIRKREINALAKSDFRTNAEALLKKLLTKRADLESLIADIPEDDPELMLPDRGMTVSEKGSAIMKYEFTSTPFTRRLKLEEALDKVDGRIMRLLSEIQKAETEERRFHLDQQKFAFSVAKTTGVYNFDVNGEFEIIE